MVQIPDAPSHAGSGLTASSGMRIQQDDWLSGVAGYPVYRTEIEADVQESSIPEAIATHARGRTRALYYAKIDTERVRMLRALSGAGFYPVDVNVTFAFHAETPRQAPPADCEIRTFETAHERGVLDVAGSCFRYSRFHLDPMVGRETADRIKREWVRNYVRGERGEALFTAILDGRPVGFLAALASMLDGKRAHVIDLIGVDEAFQGRGIGRALVSRFVETYAGRGERLLVGTQAANIPSMALYQRCGFVVSKTAYVLHKHLS